MVSIDVVQAGYNKKLELHKKYHIKSISKSPVYLKFDADVDISSEDEIIAFLRYIEKLNSYEYCVEDAYLSVAGKSLVIELVKQDNLPLLHKQR